MLRMEFILTILEKFMRDIFIVLMALWQLVLAQGSVCIMGGGGESTAAMQWFVMKAQYGKIINIDVDEAAQGYADDFIQLGASPSSHPLQISTRTQANDSAVYQELISASGIFIEGGDQWDYVSTWKGTLVEDAIHEVFHRGGVIGGTSAGAAILGEVVFDASRGTAYSDEVIYNPYHTTITFTDNFLEILPDVLTDTHFSRRGRLGRLVTMLARRIQDYNDASLIGIGVDEYTAFCVDEKGVGQVMGDYSVFLVYPSPQSDIFCYPGQPLRFTHLKFHQLVDGVKFDIRNRKLVDPGPRVNAIIPSWNSGEYSSIILDGSDSFTDTLGTWRVDRMETNGSNAYNGRLNLRSATNRIPNSTIIPKCWVYDDYLMNRIVGGTYAGASHPGIVVIYIDQNTWNTVQENGVFRTDKTAMILDTRTVTHIGTSAYSRNFMALINATLHILSNDDQWNLKNTPTVIKPNVNSPASFELKNPYPNPFNGQVILPYNIPRKEAVFITIVNSLGQVIHRQKIFPTVIGNNNFIWEATKYPSGTYLVLLQVNGIMQTRKVILIK